MTERTIAVPDDVYHRLEAERRSDESVVDVLERLLESPALADFWGAWSDETAATARDAIAEARSRSRRTVCRDE